MRLCWGVAVGVAILAAACGQAPGSASLLRAAPQTYLLSIDQLVSPDFTLDRGPHGLSAADIAAGTVATARQLASAGFVSGAAEEFFRAGANLADVNGPVQVRDTVEEFASAGGASAVFAADVRRLDAVSGAAAVSTGALGDAAHATTRTATSASGDTAVEITVEWRLDNLVDVLLVRGRQGGTRLDDALILAHRQTAAELGLPTPTPTALPSALP